MTPERYQRLKPLFEKALELPPEERSAFVDEACKDAPQDKRDLQDLLARHDEKTGTLDNPIFDVHPLMPPREQTFSDGTVLLDQFKIVRSIGTGGMGEVYEAVDLQLPRERIALKTVRPSTASGVSLARFKEEVMLARQVRGSNVCSIYAFYESPGTPGERGCAFYTMEFLQGVTLAERIAAGPMPHKEAMRIALQLCEALRSIHSAGVIHRDLKPNNIMLVPRNGGEQAVVMDFGLARSMPTDPGDAETGLTKPGMIMGNPGYMAPEQFEPGARISPATDIYSLGIVLYEMVTGKRPFPSNSFQSAAMSRSRPPVLPSSIRHGLPAVWDDVISRCLENEPARRYQSADEVMEALHQHSLVIWRFSQGQRIALTPRVAIIAGAVLVMLFSVSGWALYRTVTTYRPSETAKRWYDDGVAALRDGTYLKAANALAEAVKSDPKYALAHARLADAWAELDSTGQAQQEMLLAAAAEQKTSLPDEDKRYVEAVQATLIRDYSAAAQDYEEILKQLPDDRRADGLVDLGRAYEKAGRVKETRASYEQAATLNPDDPAPFVHLGIWKSRQRDPDGAEKAFSRAEELYRAKSNQEGLAEVAYQRGYAANEAADSAHARQYLEVSLNIARQINSSQLEARTLSQLSSVEYNDSKDDKAIDDANQAIQIARENDLEYWSTDGLTRIGNAYLDKQDIKNAELYLEQAHHLAQQNQHPRLIASSSLSLASLRDQQGRRDDQISLARDALRYYADFGFMNAAADASALVVRGEEGKGEFSEALRSGTEMLELANKTNSQPSIERAEELVGNVLADLQEYPTALTHYERALEVSQTVHENEGYQRLHCADTLWRLGRYRDAGEMLASISSGDRARADIASGIEDTRAEMQISQARYRDALNTSSKALQDFPDAPAGKIADFVGVEALAEGEIGGIEQANGDLDRLQSLARKEADASMAAAADLIEADVSLRSHLPGRAQPLAEQADRYFSSKGKKESEWLSLFYMAKAAKASGDAETCANKATQAIDILNYLERSWGATVFHQYASRPDYQLAMRQLSLLIDERIPQHHERAKGY